MAAPRGQGDAHEQLQRHRRAIDDIDRRLRDLLQDRTRHAEAIAAIKRETGLPLRDAAREREVIEAVVEDAGAGLTGEEIAELFRTILKITRGHFDPGAE